MRFLVCLSALLLWSGVGCAGVQPAPGRVALDTGGGAFAAVSVRDRKGCVKWYSEQFGMRETFTYVSEAGDVGISVLSAPGLTLEIQEHAAAAPADTGADKGFLRHGIFKFGVHVQEVDGAVATLKAAGARVVVAPFDDDNNRVRTAVLADPCGNTVQLLKRL
ncbi:MAG: VOC family protein [Polyangiaceae bacterium]